MIDKNKPIRFVGDHDRPITLVGVMLNGNLVVASIYGNGLDWENPLVFDQASGACTNTAHTLKIENAPVIDSGFWPLHGKTGVFGRGFTVLAFVWSEYPEITHAIEIITKDKVPFYAEIHARP